LAVFSIAKVAKDLLVYILWVHPCFAWVLKCMRHHFLSRHTDYKTM
jgi:hypothetical protein